MNKLTTFRLTRTTRRCEVQEHNNRLILTETTLKLELTPASIWAGLKEMATQAISCLAGALLARGLAGGVTA